MDATEALPNTDIGRVAKEAEALEGVSSVGKHAPLCSMVARGGMKSSSRRTTTSE